eukprot:jgi/Chrpa1/21125/Chrysochromulina_OHIO_Genome00008505-RA
MARRYARAQVVRNLDAIRMCGGGATEPQFEVHVGAGDAEAHLPLEAGALGAAIVEAAPDDGGRAAAARHRFDALETLSDALPLDSIFELEVARVLSHE